MALQLDLAASETLTMPLPRDQIARFRTEGFLVMPALFAFEEIGWLRHAAEVAARRWSATHTAPADLPWTDEAPAGTVYGLHDADASLGRLARHPRLIGIARQLVGGDVRIVQSRLIHRQMTLESARVWRRDATTWSAVDRLPASRVVTLAVCLGPVGADGLAIDIARGSQRTPHHVDAQSTSSVAAAIGSVLALDSGLAYSLTQAAARGGAVFFVSYGALGADAGSAGRPTIFADGHAPAVTPEADDGLWPSALCAAG